MIPPAWLFSLPSFLLLAIAALTLRAFSRLSPLAPTRWAGLALLAFLLLDGGLLSALPHLGLSFGPVGSGLFYLASARLALYLPLLLAGM